MVSFLLGLPEMQRGASTQEAPPADVFAGAQAECLALAGGHDAPDNRICVHPGNDRRKRGIGCADFRKMLGLLDGVGDRFGETFHRFFSSFSIHRVCSPRPSLHSFV